MVTLEKGSCSRPGGWMCGVGGAQSQGSLHLRDTPATPAHTWEGPTELRPQRALGVSLRQSNPPPISWHCMAAGCGVCSHLQLRPGW